MNDVSLHSQATCLNAAGADLCVVVSYSLSLQAFPEVLLWMAFF